MIGHDDLPALPYPQRLETLLAAGVGLWDTIASAERRGSLDTAIRDARSAPLAELVGTLPALRCVGFNGATSAKTGRPQLAESGLALVDLPSSSPAHAAMSLAEKHERWRILEQFLR